LNNEIVGLRLFDCDPYSTVENFSIEITITELETFVLELSKDFLK
jgi:hypothetical protein